MFDTIKMNKTPANARYIRDIMKLHGYEDNEVSVLESYCNQETIYDRYDSFSIQRFDEQQMELLQFLDDRKRNIVLQKDSSTKNMKNTFNTIATYLDNNIDNISPVLLVIGSPRHNKDSNQERVLKNLGCYSKWSNLKFKKLESNFTVNEVQNDKETNIYYIDLEELLSITVMSEDIERSNEKCDTINKIYEIGFKQLVAIDMNQNGHMRTEVMLNWAIPNILYMTTSLFKVVGGNFHSWLRNFGIFDIYKYQSSSIEGDTGEVISELQKMRTSRLGENKEILKALNIMPLE